ncbi:MCE family protein [Nocardioides marmoriginsengisoli]|uniref:MCE family protein n=1 Tax=Nocardioides marmoriginsengisoli TaxID=661483 RepID=A0A3N0CH70_9ACTN|nr:MCE family protein [Nocardioides marmoriginsengisoli]RNL62792.1 MCE family protein [Nocardioides marmoriginsengisoli]
MNKFHALLISGALISTTGCSFTGINTVSLPLSKGRGDDAVTVKVQLENSTNLVPNSEVKYGEVTIGSIRKIELENWTATLTIGLEKDSKVPADVTAKVAQKSLLGAEYLELKKPTGTRTAGANDFLEDGDVIDLKRTERYPETEEVLSAASLLLNGGGLPALKTISSEANLALTGRAGDVKSFVRRVDETTRRLDAQRDSITGAMEKLDALSRTINGQSDVLDRALVSFPKGAQMLDEEEQQLLNALRGLGRLEDATAVTFAPNDQAFGRILDNLVPVTTQVANVDHLAAALESVSYPFPSTKMKAITRSDYLNLGGTIVLDAGDIAKNFLGLTSLDGLFTGFVKGLPNGAAGEATNPLTAPVEGLLGQGLDGALGGLGGKGTPKPEKSGSPTTKSPVQPTPTPTSKPNLLELLLGGAK